MNFIINRCQCALDITCKPCGLQPDDTEVINKCQEPENFHRHAPIDIVDTVIVEKVESSQNEVQIAHNKNISTANARTYFDLGNLQQQRGDLKRAINSYKFCLQFEESHLQARDALKYCAQKGMESDVNLNLGNIKFAQGDLQGAMNFFIEAKALNPSNVDAWINLSLVYHSLGKLEAAILCSKKAISFDPTNEVASYNLGCCLHDMGRMDEATLAYQSVLLLNPAHKHAYFNMGVAYHQQGKVEEAMECYTEALLIDPGFVEAQNALWDK